MVDDLLLLSGWLLDLLTLTCWWHCAWHRLGRNENGKKTRLVSFNHSWGVGKVFDIQRYPAAQETEDCTEDVITLLADKFGQPAGDDVPALISKALFPQFKRSLQLLGNLTFEEVCQHTTVLTSAGDDLPEFATVANIQHCFGHSSQQWAL